MKLSFIKIVIQLIIYDINLLIIARSMQTDELEGDRSNKFTSLFLTKNKKKTKIQYSILIINSVLVILEIISALVEYIESGVDFPQAVVDICNQIIQGKGWVFWFVLIGLLTTFFMIMAYRAVQLTTQNDEIDGNRHLSVDEVDKEYIDFSKSDSIDGRSRLLIIAGDLSFLGDIPDIKIIKNAKKRKKCKEALSDNSLKHCCCKQRKCPSNIKAQCIEKSGQFEQLFDLRNREIVLDIICKQPKPDGDILYKRRLGRLKKIFSNNISIRFLPEDTLGNGICVLGRIKVNGGLQELFWHWKDPGNPGSYTVPNTKKADTGENKTLIYLLGTTLWESANEIDDEKIGEYVEEYEKAIKDD